MLNEKLFMDQILKVVEDGEWRELINFYCLRVPSLSRKIMKAEVETVEKKVDVGVAAKFDEGKIYCRKEANKKKRQ